MSLNNSTIYFISFILSFIFTVLAIYKLYTILKNDIDIKILAILSSILIVLNIFSIELYLFLEKGILILSVLCCILALESIVKFFKGNKKSIILSFIYMIIANFAYQGTVAIFVALSAIYIIKYTKNIKSFIINNIATAVCYGGPALINYLWAKKIFINPRMNSEYNIIKSVEKIIMGMQEMVKNTYNILPKYLFILILLAIIIIGIISILNQKEKKSKKVWLILGIPYIIILTITVTILPQMLLSTDSISFVPRSTFAFSSLIGLLVAYICMNVKIKDISKSVLVGILILYLSIQYISFQQIINDRYIVNYMDYNQFLQIEEKVKMYETETGKKIEKIAFYPSYQMQKSYDNIKVIGETNLKVMYTEWSRKCYLEYYFKRKFTQISGTKEIYNKYFKDKSWNAFNEGQIILIDNTMHLYVY